MADNKGAKHSEESKLNKLKHFFGIRASKAGTLNVGNARPQPQEFTLTRELLKDLSQGTPANHRLKTIRELSEVIQCKRLEENAVEVIWLTVQDLLDPKVATDDRHLALRFLQNLVRGQYQQLGMMRAQFFRVIKSHDLIEDLPQRLELFQALTSDGKDLLLFEEETGPFLLDWMKIALASPCVAPFLSLVINVIKFNAVYLDEDIVKGLIL
ncbi:hypothetical protein CAPTEDRAFT_91111 [Capitella teleta]|uniref:Tuberin N-terminal domain-containing protein n=1 Tax=Capitella teleta TaxID=283909 RepID=R7TFF6_CAPTE|nr:hypothetical protein CAPTEDRAFT_91111 [Capitella teleta]|eukprot:ELT92479.1 hypothetical protein CAPTEDRAFT_91111 [Capitella teleta]